MTYQSYACLRPRHGFSLIEAAIVLGVVGIVIGGIWVAASAVYRANKISQTASGTIMLYEQLRQRYPAALMGVAGVTITLNSLQVGQLALPAGYTFDGTYLKDPFGNIMSININHSFWGEIPLGSQTNIGFNFKNNPDPGGTYSLDPSICQQVVAKLTAAMGQSGALEAVLFMDQSTSNRTYVLKSAFPISPLDTNCNKARIQLAFGNYP